MINKYLLIVFALIVVGLFFYSPLTIFQESGFRCNVDNPVQLSCSTNSHGMYGGDNTFDINIRYTSASGSSGIMAFLNSPPAQYPASAILTGELWSDNDRVDLGQQVSFYGICNLQARVGGQLDGLCTIIDTNPSSQKNVHVSKLLINVNNTYNLTPVINNPVVNPPATNNPATNNPASSSGGWLIQLINWIKGLFA